MKIHGCCSQSPVLPDEEGGMDHSQVPLQTDTGLKNWSRNQPDLQEHLQKHNPDCHGHLEQEVKHHVEGRAAEQDLRDGQVQGEEL